MGFEVKSKKDKLADKTLKEAIEEYDAFFGYKHRGWQPNLFFVPDRATIDALKGRKTERWIIGWISGAFEIYLLSRENFERDSSHPYSDRYYASLIRHELAHIYVARYSVPARFRVPIWLNEGIAIYLSGQVKSQNQPKKLRGFLKSKYDPAAIYGESGFAVWYLVEEYGKRKLLKLLKSVPDVSSNKEFRARFEEIYGFKMIHSNFKVPRSEME